MILWRCLCEIVFSCLQCDVFFADRTQADPSDIHNLWWLNLNQLHIIICWRTSSSKICWRMTNFRQMESENWLPHSFHLLKTKFSPFKKNAINYPIGSMYAIYGNIYHQYTPNVSIYTIHGSYGYGYVPCFISEIPTKKYSWIPQHSRRMYTYPYKLPIIISYIYIYIHLYIHTYIPYIWYIYIYRNIFDMYISIFVCISPKVPMVFLLISGLALDYQVLPTQQCGAGWSWRTAPVVVLEIPWKLAGEVWLSVRVSSMKNCSENGIGSLELLVIHGDSLFTKWSN